MSDISIATRSLLSRWRSDPEVGGNVVEWHTIPARPARLVPMPLNLHPVLVDSLQALQITSLYSHQSTAWELAQRGENLVIVTGTASGKTLCYNLPTLDCLLRDPEGRALYLFPTKALSQDQSAVLKALLLNLGKQFQAAAEVRPAVYDGDTPAGTRSSIRAHSRLVISNPDMLHTGILPHHTSWAAFFRNLRYVVIDEIHTYRGVFGSHVANVIRRLKRIARFYGADPQYILTSATVGNPQSLAERLIEERVTLVDDDGAAHGQKIFLVYNPPIVNPDLGIRRSAAQESVRLAEDLLTYGIQTIVFGRTRRSVEIILAYLRERIGSGAETINSQGRSAVFSTSPETTQIRGYRSGYLPGQRRGIERGLREGDVRVVVATNALELGIDIGGMGAAVLAGYPGTIAATWQQAGRAGRGEATSLAVLVASASPLDQYLARHPEYFFGRTPEQALINPDNLLILLGHLRCAAFELPFQVGESFGNVDALRLQEFLDYLQNEGLLHHSGSKYFWMADQYPAQGVSLRSASPDTVLLHVQTQDDLSPRVIGEVDCPSATWMVHPGAIYFHEAQTYFVSELDLEQRVAVLEPVSVDYYTEPRSETIVNLVEKLAETESKGCIKAYGNILVTTQVVGYRKVGWHTHENLGLGELDLPPSELDTTGYWLSLTDVTVNQLREQGMWAGDPNRYGPGWPALRERVRARDGYCCQSCGILEQEREHDVHHKVPFRSFTSPELANQLGNLVTLCPACHRRAEAAVRIRSGLAGLAFTLEHLAPLFLMCDAGDLGVHADPQSALSDGQPAVVVYDRVPAGVGFSERLYEIHAELMIQARGLISGCACQDGCPSCVGPGGEAGSGGKRETLALLELLCD